MSTTIDQRVVEMRFDNKHFESNVSTTMSTLDKLKQKLHLDGATKGLENVNSAAKNVKMDGLGTAVESVSAKFSALQVVGVTALANITNSAVNAGKRIISALTIDPVRSGLDEYETKMGSIQTILANTEHQGTTLDDVTAALDKLNTYADKTIYNFQQMTRNIGTFTAAGVDLDTSVKSIQGIANLAAVSGSTSQQASTAMYQLSQALASGTVKLMDWNSVVNAGMGGKVFQNALIRTAAMLDGAAADVEAWQKKNVDAHGSFRDSLTSGAWLTTEVLTKTLEQFTMAAEEGSEEWKAFKKELMDMGYAEAQAEEILKMANTATDAATKVKTFTQLFDTLKESAQSGWAQTWELIFGDFEEAKEFFTGLSDGIGGLLGTMSDWRNNIIGEAFNSNWDKLVNKLSDAGKKSTEYEEKIREVMKAHGETDDSIDKLIEKYGSLEKAVKAGAISTDILKEALAKLGINTSESNKGVAAFVESLEKIKRVLGYGSVGDDVKSLQTALEELGYSVGECKIDGIIGPDTTKAIKEFQESAGLVVDGIAGPQTLAALKKAGNEIENLSDDVKKVDATYDDLIDNITKKGGRELFLEGFQNVIGALLDVLKIFGKAWSNIFPAEGMQNTLFRAIEGFNKLAKSLRLYTEVTDDAGKTTSELTDTGKNILRTFEGLLAAVDIVATVISGPLKFAIKIATGILNKAGLTVLDVTASIGDILVAFRDKVDKVITGVTDFIVEGVTKWIDKFKETEFFKTVSEWIKDAGDSIKETLDNITESFENFSTSAVAQKLTAFGQAISTFAKGIANSKAGKTIINSIVGAFEKVKNFFVNFTLPDFSIDGMKTWTTKLKMIGDNIKNTGGVFSGTAKWFKNSVLLLNWNKFKNNALNNFATWIVKTGDTIKKGFEKAKEICTYIKEFIFGTDAVRLSTILDLAEKFLALLVLFKALQALNTFTSAFDNITGALQNLSANLKWQAIGAAFKGMALALAAVAICLVIIKDIPLKDALKSAAILVGVIAALTGAVIAISIFTKQMEGINAISAAASLLMISGAILLMVMVLKQIDGANFKNIGKTFTILGLTIIAMAGGIKAIAKAGGSAFASVAAVLTLLSALQLILTVIDAYDAYDWTGKQDAINKMTKMLIGLSIAINLASRGVMDGGSAKGLGVMLLAMILSLHILLDVMEDFAAMKTDDLIKGGLVITALLSVMTGVMVAVGLTNKGTVLEKGQRSVNNFTGLAIALLTMVGVIWALGKMPIDVLLQGGIAVTLVMGMLIGMLAVIAKANAGLKEGAKAVNHFVGLAMTLVAIVAAIYILGTIKDTDALKQGCLVVGGILLALTTMLAVIGKTCTGINTGSITAMLSTLGVIVVLLAVVLWRMEDLDTSKALSNAIALSALLLAMSVAIRSVKAGNQKVGDLVKWAGAMVALSGLLFILGFLLGQVNDLDPVNAIASATALGILLIAMSGACAILGKVKFGDMGMAIGAMAGLVIILAALTIVLRLVNDLDPVGSIGNVVALSILLNAMAAAIYILSNSKSMDWKKMGTVLISMTVLTAILYGLVGVLHLIKSLDPVTAIGHVVALSAMLNAMSAAMLIISNSKTMNWKKMGTVLISMTVLTAILYALVGVLHLLKTVDPLTAIGHVTALSIMLNAMSAAMLILSNSKTMNWKKMGTVLISMGTLSAILYALVGVLHLMKSVDPINAIGHVTALSALLNAMSAALLILSYSKGMSWKKMGTILISMTTLSAILYALVGVIHLLKTVDPVNAIGHVTALSILLNAMSTALLILSYSKTISGMALLGMAALAGVLLLLVPTMHLIQGLELPLGNVISLSVLLNAMASALLILSYAKTISPMALVGMAAMGLVVGELAYMLRELTTMNCTIAISTAISLSTMLIAMSVVYAILGATGGLAGTAIAGATGMIAVIGILGAVAIAIGGIMSLIPAETISSWKEGLQNFLDFLVILAEGLGSIVSGFVVGFTDGLVEAGENLKMFANSLGEIKPEAVTGVEALCDAINALTSANLKDALVQLLPGDNSLSTFGENISTFATCIMDAAGSLSLITDTDVENIKRAATAGSALADLNAAIPKQGGWAQDILGAQDLSVWGQSIVAFAGCLVRYSNTVTGNPIDVEAVKNSAAAGTSLSDLSNAIPKQDGWAQEILGDQDLATFGKSIVAFGRCLVDYSAIVTGQPIDKEAILLSADAGTALAELADVIPKQDGWWQEIAGEQDLGTFGRSLTAFANGVLSYCRVAVQIDDEKVEAIKNSGTAIDEIVKVMDKIPEEGGWGEAIFGGQDGQSFGQALSSVARGIMSYCNMAAQIDDDDITAIGNTGDAITKLGEVLENVPDTGDSEKTAAFSTAVTDISSIASTINSLTASGYEYGGLDTLKTAIGTLSSIVTEIDTTSIFSGFNNLKSAVENAIVVADKMFELGGYSYTGIDSFKEALTNLAGADLQGVIDAFSGKAESMVSAVSSLISAMSEGISGGSEKVVGAMNSLVGNLLKAIGSKLSEFKKAGQNFATYIKTGLSESNLSAAGTAAAAKAVSGVRAKYGAMVSAGTYLGEGLVSGISAKGPAVYTAAYALGQLAVQGEKDGQASNSPSKLTIQAGKWLGEGLVIGIQKMGNAVHDAGASMGKTATGIISSAIAKVADMVDNDIDAQPTIRPVLDLSDVESGVGTLGNMLGMGSSIGVSANVGAISSMMNARSQNGANHEVVSAIDKLRNDLGKVGNTSYHIDGVTYDDGSNVSEAIKTIIRYANIERRV